MVKIVEQEKVVEKLRKQEENTIRRQGEKGRIYFSCTMSIIVIHNLWKHSCEFSFHLAIIGRLLSSHDTVIQHLKEIRKVIYVWEMGTIEATKLILSCMYVCLKYRLLFSLLLSKLNYKNT